MASQFERLVGLVRSSLKVREVNSSLPFGENETSVWKLARKHNVITLLASSVVESKSPPGFFSEAEYVWQLAALREEFYFSAWEELRGFFEKANIPCFLLKGLLLARKAYPKRGLRLFRDMDVLVRPLDLPHIHSLLIEKDFFPIRCKGPLPRALLNQGDVLHAASKGIDALSYQRGELNLEIHTSLVPPLLGNFPFKDGWEKNQFSPEQVLIHLMVHATRHHFHSGLSHLVDLWAWIHSQKPNLGEVKNLLDESSLWSLAWPCWKMASLWFPTEILSPPEIKNPWVLRYTRFIQNHFSEIGEMAAKLSGTPLPFVLMKRKRFRNLTKIVWGASSQKEYQLKKNPTLWSQIKWRMVRPFGLLYRHAQVVFQVTKLFVNFRDTHERAGRSALSTKPETIFLND